MILTTPRRKMIRRKKINIEIHEPFYWDIDNTEIVFDEQYKPSKAPTIPLEYNVFKSFFAKFKKKWVIYKVSAYIILC